MDKEALKQIGQIIDYKFSDSDLLAQAFTHSSAVDHRLLSNERLEFLGDAILSLVVCENLFERFTGYLEGNLTKIKSAFVSRRNCARITKELGLQKFLKVGKGMALSPALSGSLAAGLLEATIAAIYIDGGLAAAKSFILRAFSSIIEQADSEQIQDNFKSMLQQYTQEHFNMTPFYALLDEKGPDHNKCFELEVIIANRHFPSAWGTNKKEAEQKAAFNALVELGVLEKTSSQNYD